MDLRFHFDDYLLYLTGQGRRPATLLEKRQKLGVFLDWLQGHLEAAPGLADLTSANYRAFLQYLKEARFGQHHDHIEIRPDQPLGPYTIRSYAKVVKTFSRWLSQEGHYTTDPLGHEQAPTVPRQQVKPFTDHEVDQLIAAIDWQFPEYGIRLLAILLFLLDTGIRLGELVTLTDDRVWLDDRRALVTGKGQKQRYVPFGVTCCRYLNKYMAQRPPPLGSPAYVFRANDGGQLSGRRVRQLFAGLGDRAEVAKVHPHRFRHTFGYRYIRNGGDVFSLQRILGHVTVSTTMIYVNMQSDDIAQQHAQFSPVNQLRGLPRVR